MNNLHVKTGDNVMIISGKDKGHTGKVLQVSPSENKVIVEGQNMVTKHVKPRRQGEQGGIGGRIGADDDLDVVLAEQVLGATAHPAGDDGVGISVLDRAVRLADGVGRGRAGGHHRQARPARAKADGDVGGCHVVDHRRDKIR